MFWIRRKLSICAIIATRNEAHYLKVLLPILGEQKIDVAIVDNGSTDESYELYSNYMGKPIIMVENLVYRGIYSLSELLAKKQEIIKKNTTENGEFNYITFANTIKSYYVIMKINRTNQSKLFIDHQHHQIIGNIKFTNMKIKLERILPL